MQESKVKRKKEKFKKDVGRTKSIDAQTSQTTLPETDDVDSPNSTNSMNP